ncbi:BQ2448_4258 [Microbotryum intermedium]|uniref:BQ2448_4258 protein n=1 Tax=Microbotryum intermedium TaxID=269621 RepID=A0A238FKP6_9BASI|nr:BQ2448_4258 [Microbotryum intermedium]
MRTPSTTRVATTFTTALLATLTTAAPADNTIEIVGNSGVSRSRATPRRPRDPSSPNPGLCEPPNNGRAFSCGSPAWPDERLLTICSITSYEHDSAQQLFLGQSNKVYIVDKTERNPVNTTSGHPAWASEYDYTDNTFRTMDIRTNSFCAGGNVLGNGTWINIGGNQPVGPGGLNANQVPDPYVNGDGGKATRRLDVCTDQKCDWIDDGSNYMTTRRWYPTLETLEDGSMIVIGGCDWGGYVNDKSQNNPTYEYYPSQGGPIGLNILTTTLPANLFPLTWLLPSGNIFINANLGTEIFDYKNNVEYPLADIPHAVRTYPGSAATGMLPLTPANNWTATILFCGGTNLQPDQWVTSWNIAAYPADSTCVSMTPDVSTNWVDEDSLPEGRVMGNLISLPDGRFVLINGIGKGTAGYGNTSWAIGQSFGDEPVHSIRYYDPNASSGKRFSNIIANSTVDRMYHSSATLLPDGSILSSGSNPNADYVAPNTPGYTYFTEYRVERFYPDYFTATRPQPTGLPTTLGYGGSYFNVTLSKTDVGNVSKLDNTMVVLIRPGFSTHAMNMGQRYVQLNSTFTANSDGSAVLHVSPVPPNAAILVPGPCLIFVVVDGIPSIGQWVTIGNGQLGAQTISPVQRLPASTGGDGKAWNSGNGTSTSTSSAAGSAGTSGSGSSGSNTNNSAGSGAVSILAPVFAVLGGVLAASTLLI